MAIAPSADEVSEIGAKDGCVPTSLWRQAFATSVLMGHPYTLVSGTIFMRCIVNIASLLVVAIDVAHLIVATLHLTDQMTVHIIQIKVHPPVTIAGQKDMLFGKLDVADGFVLDVASHLVLDDHFTLCGQRICHINTQAILMAIHCIDGNALGIAGHHDAWNIAVSIDRNLQLACLCGTDVIRPHRAGRVPFACNGILIGVETRIVGILSTFGFQAFEQRHRVLLDLTLVVTNPAYLATVGGEGHSTVVRELLFIHPIGNTVDDLVATTVFSYLDFGLVINKTNQEDVIVADEGNLRTIGREQGCLLGTVI